MGVCGRERERETGTVMKPKNTELNLRLLKTKLINFSSLVNGHSCERSYRFETIGRDQFEKEQKVLCFAIEILISKNRTEGI